MINILQKLTLSDKKENDFNFDSNLGDGEDFSSQNQYDDDALDEDLVFTLPIDLYQDDENVYLRTFIPGVEPSKINIEIARDVIEISGERVMEGEIDEANFVEKELVWGEFKKRIMLPDEVDILKVRATNKNGMLSLKMPKLDKYKKIKINLN